MKILVINCGSSSLKYQLIDMDGEQLMAKGLVERIGIEGSRVKHETTGKDKKVIEQDLKDHKDALKIVMDSIIDSEYGAIASLDEIGAVGHRVVHGGEDFADSVIIDEAVIEAIKKNFDVAPLHNPPNIMGIEAVSTLLPNVKQVAVFDTAFHQTMPAKNYIYALPYDTYEDYKIRRYGFHGTSHKYVTERAADMVGKSKDQVNLVTCHLGNGASITAVKEGKSYDTTMGFTPLEGLPMGTRSGNIDPAIITFLMDKKGLDGAGIDNLLNKESGVLGISGVSSDFRDIEEAMANGNQRAELALDVYETDAAKFIAGYFTHFDALEDIDGIVFTAGLGENSAETRANIIKKLSVFGVEIDSEANAMRGEEKIVSTDASSVKVMVIPTNEELMIARDTLNLVK
ncbi:acetate kinase [Peptoniphilus equinus]|uniref:Acetate kinase n=1 Tax=Peptoniphilus equinus TaxID=3016343 RepID=A0ABY7QSU6_9FIRM|nr:acetate kinase [Peptoniphilus equinus]WBW49541.1 acetate kinase [Peptoniphilus equinus]